MLSFFSKNKDNESNKYSLHIKTAALLIYAAKIDENYSDIEKKIIKTTLVNLGINKENLEKVFKKAENIESNSNQILEFTKEIKKNDMQFRLLIIELLWKIIYSDGIADHYETNLIRRVCGLLYISEKDNGDIKLKVSRS